jgi:hypothetical protein
VSSGCCAACFRASEVCCAASFKYLAEGRVPRRAVCLPGKRDMRLPGPHLLDDLLSIAVERPSDVPPPDLVEVSDDPVELSPVPHRRPPGSGPLLELPQSVVAVVPVARARSRLLLALGASPDRLNAAAGRGLMGHVDKSWRGWLPPARGRQTRLVRSVWGGRRRAPLSEARTWEGAGLLAREGRFEDVQASAQPRCA